MERYFVYIIYSGKHDKYYKGFSTQPQSRLSQHNKGESTYTKQFIPWELIYMEELPSKKEALKREKGLKKYSKTQIQELLTTSKNLLK